LVAARGIITATAGRPIAEDALQGVVANTSSRKKKTNKREKKKRERAGKQRLRGMGLPENTVLINTPAGK
jgi:hypothetical protein